MKYWHRPAKYIQPLQFIRVKCPIHLIGVHKYDGIRADPKKAVFRGTIQTIAPVFDLSKTPFQTLNKRTFRQLAQQVKSAKPTLVYISNVSR